MSEVTVGDPEPDVPTGPDLRAAAAGHGQTYQAVRDQIIHHWPALPNSPAPLPPVALPAPVTRLGRSRVLTLVAGALVLSIVIGVGALYDARADDTATQTPGTPADASSATSAGEAGPSSGHEGSASRPAGQLAGGGGHPGAVGVVGNGGQPATRQPAKEAAQPTPPAASPTPLRGVLTLSEDAAANLDPEAGSRDDIFYGLEGGSRVIRSANADRPINYIGRPEPTKEACETHGTPFHGSFKTEHLTKNDVICFRTNEGRIAAVRLEQDPQPSPWQLPITYITWPS